MSRRSRRILISIAAGAPLPLAFAPFGWFWLAPLSYAALFYAWRGATPKQAFGAGWLFGAASFLGGIYWIYISVHGYGGAPAALGVFLTVGLVAIMALYSGAVGWIAARWFRLEGAGAWLVTLPALWVLAEWWRGWFLSGFGWLSAGYTQTDSWLIGYAPVAGLLGVSWAVLLMAGAAITLVLGGRRERLIAGASAVAVVAAGFGLGQVRWTAPGTAFLTTALVQGAVPQDQKWLPEQLPKTLVLYRELTEEALGAELIVWPEAAIPQYYSNMRRYLGEIEREAAAAGSTVMLGMLRYDLPTDAGQNAVFALGHPEALYVKRHLVPYGEYYPAPEFVRSWLSSMGLPVGDTGAGKRDQPLFDLLGERISVTICYEDVFGAELLDALPEATLLVNVSNDAWFGASIAGHQHLQIARMRAAEAGRYLLRATNTGITAVIGPDGRIEAQIPRFESGVLSATVRGYTGATPYARWGNYLVLALAAAALAAQLLTTKLTMRPGT